MGDDSEFEHLTVSRGSIPAETDDDLSLGSGLRLPTTVDGPYAIGSWPPVATGGSTDPAGAAGVQSEHCRGHSRDLSADRLSPLAPRRTFLS